MMPPDYSYYLPMSFDDAKRLSCFQAQQYALERIGNLMHDSVMGAAFTEDERATLRRILSDACQRVSMGIAEYDGYKRREPVTIDVWEAGL